MSNIRIISHKPLNSKGTLKAFLKIEITKWALQINGVLLHGKDKTQWVQLPVKEYLSDGHKKYSPIMEFRDESVFNSFQDAVLQALSEYKPSEYF
jgi:hypothetical protein